jgi:transposase-like protein
LNGKESILSGKNRVFSVDFKEQVAQRILGGESVSALQHELQIKRTVLYRWRDVFRKEGVAGLQRTGGRPLAALKLPRPVASQEEAGARRMGELERKIGQQAMDLEFFQRAFKRVKESRRKNTKAGETASTEKSKA